MLLKKRFLLLSKMQAFVPFKTVVETVILFSGLFDEYKVQKYNIYLKRKSFATLKIPLQLLLINLICLE